MGKVRDKNLKHVEWIARNTRTSQHTKQMINEYVDLYRYPKIAQQDTVINAIICFASTNTKTHERSLRICEADVDENEQAAIG